MNVNFSPYLTQKTTPTNVNGPAAERPATERPAIEALQGNPDSFTSSIERSGGEARHGHLDTFTPSVNDDGLKSLENARKFQNKDKIMIICGPGTKR